MYADPAVVRRKVERELKEYVEHIDQYRARGIWVLEYIFPELLVAFASPKTKPAVAPYGVLLDLRNYDVEPPSIRFVNPFTRAPLTAAELNYAFPRYEVVSKTPVQVQRPPAGEPAAEQPPAAPQGFQVQLRPAGNLLQFWGPADDHPFICLAGVREYHDNPGHTSDSWWLHRAMGAGRLVTLLNTLSKYGTEQIVDMSYQAFGFREFLIQPNLNFA